MLISMPQGTSTIFGAFQAILALHFAEPDVSALRLNYCLTKSSPVKSCPALAQAAFCCGAHATEPGRNARQIASGPDKPVVSEMPLSIGANSPHWTSQPIG
jgi:hypothetical protein